MIYAIISGKGGVGKTTLAANLGPLAAELGKKTLLVDTDLAAGNLALYLGLTEPSKTLHDLLAGEKDIHSCIYSLREGLDVLPAGLSLKGFLKADIAGLPQLMKKVTKGYEVVILDTPPGISRNSIVPLKCADLAVLVTTADPPSLTVSVKMKAIASILDRRIAGTVINRVEKGFLKKNKPAVIAKQLGTEIVGTIPEDDKVKQSIELGKPIVLHRPKSQASKALRAIALSLFGG